MVRPMYDPNEDKREKKQAKAQRQLEISHKLDCDEAARAIMDQAKGRRYIYWLLTLGSIGRNPFTNNALSTAFSCGELNVAQRIQAHVMEVSPANFLKMLQEQEDDRIRAEASDGSDQGGDDT